MSVVGVLAMVVALVVALTGTWSARTVELAGVRVRVGVFDRTRLGERSHERLGRALAAIGEEERLAWIGERSAAPDWRSDVVEVVDVTEALQMQLVEPIHETK